MDENKITIKYSILIDKPAAFVWDYTQNYDNRMHWDASVLEAIVLQTTPNRIVKLKTKGNTTMTFIYKQDERPYRTSLVAKEIVSSIIQSAGGSWSYEDQNGKTLWTQTNTVIFKKKYFLKFLLPVFEFLFSRATVNAMKKAKQEMEKIIYPDE
jgi:hypothetical protein